METADFSTYLERYADLIVRHGLNVQQGQLVNISAEPEHRELAYLVARSAYKAGAHFVNLDLVDARVHRERLLNAPLESLSFVPRYVPQKYGELLETHGANLKLVGPENPDLFADLDPQRINRARLAAYNAIKPFYEDGIGKSRVHWTVAAAATRGWASRVFPSEEPERALGKLWREIFRICRIESNDFLQQWRSHNQVLRNRAAKLTALGIRRLRFVGPGTDLTVGLSERALFKGGTDVSPRGAEFEPNIPTEECFTTPDWRATAGKVAATRPFFVNGKLIKGLKLEFKDGVITAAEAQDGLETFREYIDSDEGGRRLGEVALVGIDSPVYRSGLVFEEILFDENAACHIAVGSAYKFCLKEGERLTEDELRAVGCNSSSVHTDIMISSESVDVYAETHSGERVDLLKRGEWIFV